MLACDSCSSIGHLDLAESCSLQASTTLMTISLYGSVFMLWAQDENPLCLSNTEAVCTGVTGAHQLRITEEPPADRHLCVGEEEELPCNAQQC